MIAGTDANQHPADATPRRCVTAKLLISKGNDAVTQVTQDSRRNLLGRSRESGMGAKGAVACDGLARRCARPDLAFRRVRRAGWRTAGRPPTGAARAMRRRSRRTVRFPRCFPRVGRDPGRSHAGKSATIPVSSERAVAPEIAGPIRRFCPPLSRGPCQGGYLEEAYLRLRQRGAGSRRSRVAGVSRDHQAL